MSLTFPIRSKHARHPELSAPKIAPDIKLPAFKKVAEIRVLPFDSGMGKVAATAVAAYGSALLREKFGEKDANEAQQKAAQLIEKLPDIGYKAARALEPTYDDVIVDSDEISKIGSGHVAELASDKPNDVPSKDYQWPKLDKPPALKQGVTREYVLVLPKGVNSEQEQAKKQLDSVWETQALRGDEAMLTLMAMSELARARSDTLYGGLALNALQHLHEDDTRIALK